MFGFGTVIVINNDHCRHEILSKLPANCSLRHLKTVNKKLSHLCAISVNDVCDKVILTSSLNENVLYVFLQPNTYEMCL